MTITELLKLGVEVSFSPCSVDDRPFGVHMEVIRVHMSLDYTRLEKRFPVRDWDYVAESLLGDMYREISEATNIASPKI